MTVLKCEHCDATSDNTNVQTYEWPVQEEGQPSTITACDQHAVANGFCPYCGFFVLGIGSNEIRLDKLGMCEDCYDEFKSDFGEGDEDEYYDEDADFGWDYPGELDILADEEGGRYIGPGSEYLPEADDPDVEEGGTLMQKPEFSYIGRMPGCGCLVAAILDMPDDKKTTAKWVADMIKDGLNVERVNNSIVQVQFQTCTHQPKQLSLLLADSPCAARRFNEACIRSRR